MMVEPYTDFDHAVAERLSLAEVPAICVFAPHPDDESLGCGGLIAAMSAMNAGVYIVIVSDGSLSHPNSQRFPPSRIRQIRRMEALAAAESLGVSSENVIFLEYVDSSVPGPDDPEFGAFVDAVTGCIVQSQAAIVFAPYADDPHCDHRSVHSAVHSACDLHFPSIRILEYPIWAATDRTSPRASQRNERLWRFDIRATLDQKIQAIHAHHSQVDRLIDDDADGFHLTDEILTSFTRTDEFYFEHIPT